MRGAGHVPPWSSLPKLCAYVAVIYCPVTVFRVLIALFPTFDYMSLSVSVHQNILIVYSIYCNVLFEFADYHNCLVVTYQTNGIWSFRCHDCPTVSKHCPLTGICLEINRFEFPLSLLFELLDRI